MERFSGSHCPVRPSSHPLSTYSNTQPTIEEEERSFHYWRLQDQAKRALQDTQTSPSKHQKGGRGGPRNGRDRDRDSKPKSRPQRNEKPRSKTGDKKKEEAEPVEALKAGKTRGEVEPSGESSGQGVRGAKVPMVVATTGKRKAEEGGASPEKKAKVEE